MSTHALDLIAEKVLRFIAEMEPSAACTAHSAEVQAAPREHGSCPNPAGSVPWAVTASAKRRTQTPGFDALALELFALQFEYNPSYRAYCEQVGRTPATVRSWDEIPAVHTDSFKDFEMTCIPAGMRTCVFRSSGTTAGARSRHFHSDRSLRVYREAFTGWFFAHVVPEWWSAAGDAPGSLKLVPVVLTPPPAEAPDSSLAHMLGTVAELLAPEHTMYFAHPDAGGGWALDLPGLRTVLGELEAGGMPAVVLAPAYALVQLCEWLRTQGQTVRLAPGSRIMETGGYKGRVRAIPRAEFYRLLVDMLGVPVDMIISEYGMCEISSQAYDHAVSPGAAPGAAPSSTETIHAALTSRWFHFPPWVRACAISPESGQPAAPGQPGMLRVLDLANVYSVCCVLTSDVVLERGGWFQLLGRNPNAQPRGCSLMMV